MCLLPYFYHQVGLSGKLSGFFSEGRQLVIFLLQVYKGYVDDPRNTDNSWMETVAVNFHDDLGIINYEECYSFFFLSPLLVRIFLALQKVDECI